MNQYIFNGQMNGNKDEWITLTQKGPRKFVILVFFYELHGLLHAQQSPKL